MPRRSSVDSADPSSTPAPRGRGSSRLSVPVIVAAAVGRADREEIDAVSMRRVAQDLGVDPMSLYYHVKDKGALLAAMVDAVIAEIPPAPAPTAALARQTDAPHWTDELRTRILAARTVMGRHPWAVPVLLSQPTPTPAALAHIEDVLGVLRRGGCSVALTHHALHVLGSRILGFSQDLFDDSPDTPLDPAVLAAWATTHPHAAELAVAVSHTGELGGCDDDTEFVFALDLLLEGLERSRQAEASAAAPVATASTVGDELTAKQAAPRTDS